MIKKKFLETVREYRMFNPGETVLVAVSGGTDSTALLHLMHAHAAELGLSLHVAHLNHMLRKGEAELDVKYVEGLTQKLGLPLTVEAVDVAGLAQANKTGIEETARKVRYEFFDRVAGKVGAGKVAVGHTADDNVETFLMRLLRGSGLKGLCGIPVRRGKLVRPMIKIWRRQIEDYVGALKLVPRRDHTNYESKYMRNSVRLKLIPQLKIYNLNIKEIILQTILLLTEDNIYLEDKAGEALAEVTIGQTEDALRIDISRLKNWGDPIQGHLLRQAIERVKGDLKELSFQHICDIQEKLDATERWELHLPGGIFVIGERGELAICRQKPKFKEIPPFRYALSLPGAVEMAEINRVLHADFTDHFDKTDDPDTAFVDYDALGKEIIVRSKSPGDRFSPLGTQGTKKLQDFYVDEKVPAEERDSIPIVESGGRIIWVAGRRIDDNAKVTENTQRIVKFELR
jgi:tRNA(Ile)-lysidine synthase